MSPILARKEFPALWTTQVGCARLNYTIERCTKFISSGGSASPVRNSEVGHGTETSDNCHFTNPDRGQGAFAFASSWGAGSGKDYIFSMSLWFRAGLSSEEFKNAPSRDLGVGSLYIKVLQLHPLSNDD